MLVSYFVLFSKTLAGTESRPFLNDVPSPVVGRIVVLKRVLVRDYASLRLLSTQSATGQLLIPVSTHPPCNELAS